MTIEERVIEAQANPEVENLLIKEYIPFVISCANKAAGKYVTKEDDEFSVAIYAFHEAIEKYEPQKGAYLSFARLIIKNRITDYLRKEYNHREAIPFSALQTTDDDGDVIEFDIAVNELGKLDIKYEIEALNYELSGFEITFFDVAKNSPKSGKTKKECASVIRHIIDKNGMVEFIREKKYIPVKEIISDIGVNRKILERHRNYIIAVVLVMSGEYEIIQGQFSHLMGGVR